MTTATKTIASSLNRVEKTALLEKMNIVIIGHVDHGKSTLVGRLLADTDSLPQGKLAEVKARCERNARPFEYAFLLDALKDEQAQGITIDSARCFFRSSRREYILIDAPGHVEFLKNMISGAARAEAAVLVIDAKEGIQENSRRHGYLLGMLGIRQAAVCVNKLDLVNYSRQTFEAIRDEFSAFLRQTGVEPRFFIPISARDGHNIAVRLDKTDWYDGPTVLEALDCFEKEPAAVDKPLRFPVQDIYKFTEQDDERRIVAGRIETGSVEIGDNVVFLPSGKKARIASIEAFNTPRAESAQAGRSTGVTLDRQLYIQPGEVMCRAGQEAAQVATHLRVNLFWLGREPMIFNKRYLLKLGTAKVPVWLRRIHTVLDASELTTEKNRNHIERHDVAECVLETLKPVAFDLSSAIAQTGRFVIIDQYRICGGGIILEGLQESQTLVAQHVAQRERNWRRSRITPALRAARLGQKSTLVIVTGPADPGGENLARHLEETLFNDGRQVYYLGINNSLLGIDSDLSRSGLRDEFLRRLGEVSHLFTDAGLILITTVSDLDAYELKLIKTLNSPGDCLVVSIGSQTDAEIDADLRLPADLPASQGAKDVAKYLAQQHYLPEYYL
ncbi:MAG: GTP-binding protein [Anaerohalosphaeraceae bacterium]